MQQKMVDYLAFMSMNIVHSYKKNQSLKFTEKILNKILTTFDFNFELKFILIYLINIC